MLTQVIALISFMEGLTDHTFTFVHTFKLFSRIRAKCSGAMKPLKSRKTWIRECPVSGFPGGSCHVRLA